MFKYSLNIKFCIASKDFVEEFLRIKALVFLLEELILLTYGD